MNEKLIIVESPSKSKTIQSYLGDNTTVLSSKGHIRDLAISGKDGLGVDVENGFNPTYVPIKGKKQIIKQLKAAAKGKDVYIATDPDREGEAIGWHLAQVLGLDTTEKNRIIFREITKQAVTEALEHPKTLDQHLVNSQEARRILDRIIGFKLSKLLQSKIKSKSAGRVQSVALKLIVELEKKIQAFIPEKYYEIDAIFKDFKAAFYIPPKTRIKREEALKIKETSTNPFVVTKVDVKDSIRKARAPFITSTLQQDSINNLYMSASRTMSVAQKLYEGIEIDGELMGLITYMRTDSPRLAAPFVEQANQYIKEHYGEKYLGKYIVKKSDNAQDAHEAIRPTSLKNTPESLQHYLSKDEYKLYKRIYERTLASLMAPAIFETTKVNIESNNNLYQVQGLTQKFDGHYRVFDANKPKEKLLPPLEKGQQLNAIDIEMEEKETTPPARYNEASLIKEMESLGIGRPSTYASIIQTLKFRAYVKTEAKRFVPTEQGILTSEQLNLFFEPIINVKMTSQMEKALDDISDNRESAVKLLKDFYDSFIPMIDRAQKEMKKIEPQITDEICPECGKHLVVRKSRYGEFLACSGFPKCRYIKKDE